MHSSSHSIKNFGVVLFLISLVATAVSAIAVWFLASKISGGSGLQEFFIALGFGLAIGGFLISLALYFIFSALAEILYSLNKISKNTENHTVEISRESIEEIIKASSTSAATNTNIITQNDELPTL